MSNAVLNYAIAALATGGTISMILYGWAKVIKARRS